ncbi:MAG: galactose mutarotase [Dorea sp.]|nr:galactose mutarotase [Dorea sp.]
MEKTQYYEIKNEKLRVITSNLGGHLISVFVKDENGKEFDYVLGYGDVEDCFDDGGCIGAIVGRVVNRIKDAEFSLNGKQYQLAKNQGQHSIHGGFEGFDCKWFELKELKEDSITYHYTSPDMEEGYPGKLDVDVTYRVRGAELEILIDGSCDQDTIFNPTCHIYFNLSDSGEQIYHHELKIDADEIVTVDADGIPTGQLMMVEDTPFDFRDFRKIGKSIHDPVKTLIERKGYDHAFVLNASAPDAVKVALREEKSGRSVAIKTNLPVVQLYTGNYLGGAKGKNGARYEDFTGLALETQFMTDSIHVEKDPKVILRKGQTYHGETTFIFSS